MAAKLSRATVIAAALAAVLFTAETHATNGMNLEGYGPIATGMGGASFAYDNGTAAVMNNPATIGLMPTGIRIDAAFRNLGPDVEATVITPDGSVAAKSVSDAFYMPTLGLAVKKGAFAFGLCIFSQGGMGTEYENTSWLSDPSRGQNTALQGGLVNRSEVGVGRTIAPFTYDFNEKFTIGISADFVWAGIDPQMAMSEAQFQDLANPMAQKLGTATCSLVSTFGQLDEPFGGTGISRLYHAYFDFTDSSSLTGEAKGYGVTGKIGAVYRVNDQWSFGAAYHSATNIGDIETDNARLEIGMNVDPGIFVGTPTGSYEDMNLSVTGKISVKNFQWLPRSAPESRSGRSRGCCSCSTSSISTGRRS